MEYILHIAVLASLYSVLSLSLNLVVGFTGLPCVGQAAFFGVGAYTSSLLALNLHLSPWLGLLGAALLSGALGFLLSIPVVRLKGDYLALATLGSGLVLYSVAKNWIGLTRGPVGLPGIPPLRLLGQPIDRPWSFLILVLVYAAAMALFARQIVSSPFGRVLRAVRDDEVAAEALGKNAVAKKLAIFVLAASVAGITGSLYAHYMSYISPDNFTMLDSLGILLMVVLGGLGSIGGSVVGAVCLVALPEVLRFVGLPDSASAALRQILYGLLLVLLVIWRPQGLLGKYRLR